LRQVSPQEVVRLEACLLTARRTAIARKRYKPEEIIAKLRQAGAQWWCLCNRLSALGKTFSYCARVFARASLTEHLWTIRGARLGAPHRWRVYGSAENGGQQWPCGRELCARYFIVAPKAPPRCPTILRFVQRFMASDTRAVTKTIHTIDAPSRCGRARA
jgi:hypothetical protein